MLDRPQSREAGLPRGDAESAGGGGAASGGDAESTGGDRAAPPGDTAPRFERFELSGFPDVIAARTTGHLTITARAADGSVVTDYAGTVALASDTNDVVLPAPYTFAPADAGRATLPVTFAQPSCGTARSLTVTGEAVATRGGIVVTPTASFSGWTRITAVGARIPGPQDGRPSVAPSVLLSWSPMSDTADVVTAYDVSRSSPGEPTPRVTRVAAASFADDAVTGGEVYTYRVRPYLETSAMATDTCDSDREVDVAVPPNNMVLVHPFMAGLEICGQMGQSVDRANGYRCPYTGPGDSASEGLRYFRLAGPFHIDMVESGCSYTSTPGACGTSWGCVGIGDPVDIPANIGDVYYDRRSNTGPGHRCWLFTATGWVDAGSAALTAGERARLLAATPGLPPLVSVTAPRAADLCSAHGKRLPTRKEQIIAAAWGARPAEEIRRLEYNWDGTAYVPLTSVSSCNTFSTSAINRTGLLFDDAPYPAGDGETLPGCATDSCAAGAAPGFWAVRTGSNGTRDCVSLYGAQDLVGNVAEWVSDAISCDGANSCVGIVSPIDPRNTDLASFAFDGLAGPGGSSLVSGEWQLASGANDASRFLVPLGLPVVSGNTTLTTVLISAWGAEKLHEDYIYLRPSVPPGVTTRAIAGGGYSVLGVPQVPTHGVSGRWFWYSSRTLDETIHSFGFRCAVDAPEVR